GNTNVSTTDLWVTDGTVAGTHRLNVSGAGTLGGLNPFDLTVFSITVPPVQDFNNDGTSDILWGDSATGQGGSWKRSNGTPSQVVLLGEPTTSWQIAGVGDFNGDGTPDILWRDSNGGTVVTWTMSNGTVSNVAVIGTIATTWQIAGVGDFNGDGTSDI